MRKHEKLFQEELEEDREKEDEARYPNPRLREYALAIRHINDLNPDTIRKAEKAFFEKERERLALNPEDNFMEEIAFVFATISQIAGQQVIGPLKEKERIRPLTPKEKKRIDNIKMHLTEAFYVQVHLWLAEQLSIGKEGLKTYHITAKQKEMERKDLTEKEMAEINDKVQERIQEGRGYLAELLDFAYRLSFFELGQERIWQSLKKGFLGEVGLYHLLKEMELSPSLAHPKDDATGHIDMQAKDDYQVKHTHWALEPTVVATPEELEGWRNKVLARQQGLYDSGGMLEEKKKDAEERINELYEKLAGDFAEMQKNCAGTGKKAFIVFFSDGSLNDYGELVWEKFPKGFKENFRQKLRS